MPFESLQGYLLSCREDEYTELRVQPSEGKKMGMAFGLGCESGSGSGSGSGGGIRIGGEFLGWSLIIIIFSVLTRTGPDVKVVDYYHD